MAKLFKLYDSKETKTMVLDIQLVDKDKNPVYDEKGLPVMNHIEVPMVCVDATQQHYSAAIACKEGGSFVKVDVPATSAETAEQ